MGEPKIEYAKVTIRMYKNARYDYISLTDMILAFNGSKTLETWLSKKETGLLLTSWEKFNNATFIQPQSTPWKIRSGESNVINAIIKWIENSNAYSLYLKEENPSAFFAQKDIAFKFASWLNRDFELFLIREFHQQKEIELQNYSTDILSHQQLLGLAQLKEVFNCIAQQNIIEVTSEEFNSLDNTKNAVGYLHSWRNKILDLEPSLINKRIREYCVDNRIALSKSSFKKNKKDMFFLLNSYEKLRNIIWEFIQSDEIPTAHNFAKLFNEMTAGKRGRISGKTVNLATKRVSLGEYTDFNAHNLETVYKKTAGQLIAYRKDLMEKQKGLSTFDKCMKGILSVPPPK